MPHNRTIARLLAGESDNHILPFFWQHGEDEATLRELMAAIDGANCKAVCVESRPHPDFCGPKWWADMDVILDEARIFIPASLVSDTYEKDLSKYAGQEIEFVITEFNPKRRRVIGDRKQLILARKAEMQKALFERIAVGQRVEGVVKNVTDFGAFIDLGGADGLLHISEMSWGRVESPKKVFKVGEKVTALIKDINGEKIALSMKFPETNPWANAGEKYAVGTVVTGKVARMTDFGAFVELEPGVDALLHVSQISREHVAKPADVLSIGQEITAKIVDFNENDRKISLSMKALEAEKEPAHEEEASEPAEDAQE